MKKILVVSHGHPQFRKGGGEIVAYNQFKALSQEPANQVFFLAHCDEKRFFSTDSRIVQLTPKEYLFNVEFNGSNLSSFDRLWFEELSELIDKINPEVVHLHHYYKVGLESIGLIRQKLGNKVKIFVTLHEFLAICANDGQMIKGNGLMCSSSSYQDCSICDSNRSLSYTLIREARVKNYFSMVDKFFSPSNFLLERYAEWGIPRDRIEMLENGYPLEKLYQEDGIYSENSDKGFNIGFFGQFTPYKGIDLFIESALMVSRDYKQVNFFVYGGSQQSLGEFDEKLVSLKNSSKGIVNFMGKYDENQVVPLMSSMDLVVIPSRWWENSPVIVDEARAAKTPMLVANHGGLREKVVDCGFGVGFLPGSSADLSKKIIYLFENRDKLKQLKENMDVPTEISVIAKKLMKLYSYD